MAASNLADSLIDALHEPGREKLRDLVRNPLRLMLLCHTWKQDKKLPQTQAGLYEKYLKAVYRWNQNLKVLQGHATQCQTNITELKQRLHLELGELAKAALNLPQGRFLFSQSLIEEYLGEEGDETSLCFLALRLGWLKRLGKAGSETVYGFYHATFQEYFAALAVEDSDYFLPQNHEDFPVARKEYRIFAPQWKQVILLWLGRGDVAEEKKEAFIGQLVNFEDGCGEWNFEQVDRGCYSYWAYFLAVAGIREFKSCSLANEIVQPSDIMPIWKFHWSFFFTTHGFYCPEKLSQCIRTRTNDCWLLLSRTKFISILVTILFQSQDKEICTQAVHSLSSQQITTEEQQKSVVSALQRHLNPETYKNNFELFQHCYQLLWKIAQSLSYPDFYEAWHGSLPAPVNLAEFPELLRAALPEPHPWQLLIIDGSTFNPDNPVKNLYRQMLQQGCPESEDGKPKDMADLQDYWEDLLDNSNPPLALIFYENPQPPAPQGFSDTFLEALTRFQGKVCVVTEQPHPSLQTFSPDDPRLIKRILAWLERSRSPG
ncbi:hypothetical protein [Roseofilum sp. Guam]|uniref:NACHT domain-containing protein n=1 Tax=Roseofilum sp. Guam TaxID=2821502 RepID=UPI001B2BA8E4|nr:hypothetical protein [Roseofilum sp. Guam]MBP0030710.1 hypothetical protein [Roseofilum sp. Guam]